MTDQSDRSYTYPGGEEGQWAGDVNNGDFEEESLAPDPMWPLDRESVARFNRRTAIPPAHTIRILNNDVVEFDGEPYPADMFGAVSDATSTHMRQSVNVLSALLEILVIEDELVADIGDLVESRALDWNIIKEALSTAAEMIGEGWPFELVSPGNARYPGFKLVETFIEDLRLIDPIEGSAAGAILALSQSPPSTQEAEDQTS